MIKIAYIKQDDEEDGHDDMAYITMMNRLQCNNNEQE